MRKGLKSRLTSIEICAGAGGQAIGLESAGFEHVALVENDSHCCKTLTLNRPHWNVIEEDLNKFNGIPYAGIDLLAGGVPCPPFSKAGKQLGHEDERDLFPAALRLVKETNPKAVMIENVRGLFDPKFAFYRNRITTELRGMGYKVYWRLLQAANFGVPQLRPRTLLVALKEEFADYFAWPEHAINHHVTVGDALFEEMASNGWELAEQWKLKANKIAPTLVGGSKKHGGPDLGPTRAREAWAKLGIDGKGIADSAPGPDFKGQPRITVKMSAIIQGFPKDWVLHGGKTSSYKQIGNAFPPPVAASVGASIYRALTLATKPIAIPAEPVQVPIFIASSEIPAV